MQTNKRSPVLLNRLLVNMNMTDDVMTRAPYRCQDSNVNNKDREARDLRRLRPKRMSTSCSLRVLCPFRALIRRQRSTFRQSLFRKRIHRSHIRPHQYRTISGQSVRKKSLFWYCRNGPKFTDWRPHLHNTGMHSVLEVALNVHSSLRWKMVRPHTSPLETDTRKGSTARLFSWVCKVLCRNGLRSLAYA